MFVICFINQWMKRSKCGLFIFLQKKTLLNMRKALFDWSIMLQHDVNAKYGLISRTFLGLKVFSPECLSNQPKATRVCVHLINQSNRSISIYLFLFCLSFFISRSSQNCSKSISSYCFTLYIAKLQKP